MISLDLLRTERRVMELSEALFRYLPREMGNRKG
jgi:hypothetical protein